MPAKSTEKLELLRRSRRFQLMHRQLRQEIERDGWRSLAQLERWPLLAALSWIATREPHKAAEAARPENTIHSIDASMAFDRFNDRDIPWRGPHLSLSEAWHSELKQKFLEGLSCVAEAFDEQQQGATVTIFPPPESGLEPLFYYVTELGGVPVLLHALRRSATTWRNLTFAPEDILELWPPLPERTEPIAQLSSALGEPRGKQPRVIRYLRAHFPEGVPPPGLEPRKHLLTKIGLWDTTLRIMSEDTLQRAIRSYEAELKHEASLRKSPQ